MITLTAMLVSYMFSNQFVYFTKLQKKHLALNYQAEHLNVFKTLPKQTELSAIKQPVHTAEEPGLFLPQGANSRTCRLRFGSE